MKLFSVAFVLVSLAVPAMAQEHLDPDPTTIPILRLSALQMGEYAKSLRSTYGTGVRVFAVIAPSFSPGFVVGIKEVPGGYRIFGAVQADDDLSGYVVPPPPSSPLVLRAPDGKELSKSEEDRILAEDAPSRPPIKIGPQRCVSSIDRTLAVQIIQSWDMVIQQARSDGRPRIGADGDQEHFASLLPSRMIAGQTWSPQDPGKPKLLSQIAWDMFLICQKDSRDSKTSAERWAEIKASIASLSAPPAASKLERWYNRDLVSEFWKYLKASFSRAH